MSSWRRNRALFDSLRPRRETEKRSLRSLRYRNGIPAISLETLSSVTQGKQRNAIVVTQTIPLARIVLSIGEAYSWNKMPAILALREMLGLIHLFQLYASPIDKTILANGIVSVTTIALRCSPCVTLLRVSRKLREFHCDIVSFSMTSFQSRVVV